MSAAPDITALELPVAASYQPVLLGLPMIRLRVEQHHPHTGLRRTAVASPRSRLLVVRVTVM